MLLKITPIWLRWSANHLSIPLSPKTKSPKTKSPKSKHPETNSTEIQNSVPIDIINGTLKINCSSPVEASHIRHQQTNLLNTLHAAGFSNIKCIKVCMSIMSEQPNNKQQLNEQAQPIQPSTTSIQSIKSCGQKTDNSQLRESLRRLADTLNKTL